MRAAPLAFVLNPDIDAQRTRLRDICRITHHHDEAYVGGLAIVRAIRLVAFDDAPLNETLPRRVALNLPDSCVRDKLMELAEIATTCPLRECARQFGTSGYVAESVPLAIVAASGYFRDGILGLLQNVVDCGGDTDTIASMTGQIAGAAVGISALSPDMISRLPCQSLIEKTARDFCRAAKLIALT